MQKINDNIFKTYNMVMATFLVINKIKKRKFFKKMFLIGNITLKLICEIIFFILNNTNNNFLI